MCRPRAGHVSLVHIGADPVPVNGCAMNAAGIAMPGPACRIKLYGHTGKDLEDFSKKLAAVLHVDEPQAERLLRDAPVVIKEGLDKDEADKLVAMLTALRALCIVEYEGVQPVEEKAKVPSAPKPPEAEVFKPVKERDSVRSALWMAVAVGLAGFLILFSVGAYISSYINLYRKEVPRKETTEQASPQVPQPAAEIDENKIIETETRIEKLEEDLKELKITRRSAEKDLVQVERQGKTDAAQLYRAREYVGSLDTRMKNVLDELRQLKADLKRMKGE